MFRWVLVPILVVSCARYMFRTQDVQMPGDSHDVCARIAVAAQGRGLETPDYNICAAVVLPDGGINFRADKAGLVRIEAFAADRYRADDYMMQAQSLLADAELLSEAPGAVRLAVLAPAAQDDDRAFIVGVTEVVVGAADRVPGVAVVSPSEINAILGYERQQQLLGCDENVACSVEIGGALGADGLLVTAIGKIGNTRVLGFKVVDLRSSAVVGRTTVKVADESSAVIAQSEDAVSKVVSAWVAQRRMSRARQGL